MPMSSRATFYGDNLRIARLMSGISLNELGEKVGTTRQYIHQLETTDNKIPTEDLLNALAFELDVESGFFALPFGNQVKEEECHFRKLKSTLVSSRRECAARATLLNKLIESLESYLDLPDVNFPSFEDASIEDIELIAAECRKYWSLGDGPIQSMIRVVENAGAIVSTFGEVSEKVDAISLHRSRPIIIVNPTKSSARMRMDIAHELAHLVMHKGIETGDRETENQADNFASLFLLPHKALISCYKSRSLTRIDWPTVYSLKVKWGISARAIIFRLHQCEIISPSQYRTANITFSKSGQTKSEDHDDKIPTESPELLRAGITLLGNSYGDGFGGLLAELKIKPNFLADISQTKDIVERVMSEGNPGGNITNLNAYKRSLQ